VECGLSLVSPPKPCIQRELFFTSHVLLKYLIGVRNRTKTDNWQLFYSFLCLRESSRVALSLLYCLTIGVYNWSPDLGPFGPGRAGLSPSFSVGGAEFPLGYLRITTDGRVLKQRCPSPTLEVVGQRHEESMAVVVSSFAGGDRLVCGYFAGSRNPSSSP
jgi:hypothetical protein